MQEMAYVVSLVKVLGPALTPIEHGQRHVMHWSGHIPETKRGALSPNPMGTFRPARMECPAPLSRNPGSFGTIVALVGGDVLNNRPGGAG